MANMLLGIGNELKGDDGIGDRIARTFARMEVPEWVSVPCGTVPENFAGVVEREKPGLLVIVDAADMGLKPGEFRAVGKEKLGSAGFGTHGMPLSHLVSYLEGHAGRVVFIGIQPGGMRIGEKMSPEVVASEKAIISMLERGSLDGLGKL